MTHSLSDREQFRARFTQGLSQRPLKTPEGLVEAQTELAQFGFPRGNHEQVECWRYSRDGSSLTMLFGFVTNFTDDDLMCKVLPANEVLQVGAGASIQFNGNLSYRANDSSTSMLCHRGSVTIRHGISRARLLEEIARVAPQVDTRLQLASSDWPFTIGSTADLPNLLDRLFLYCYGVEQAKRSLKEESLLEPL